MLTLTSPIETLLDELPAAAKLAALAGFTFALFLTGSPLQPFRIAVTFRSN